MTLEMLNVDRQFPAYWHIDAYIIKSRYRCSSEHCTPHPDLMSAEGLAMPLACSSHGDFTFCFNQLAPQKQVSRSIPAAESLLRMPLML